MHKRGIMNSNWLKCMPIWKFIAVRNDVYVFREKAYKCSIFYGSHLLDYYDRV